jgi:hypothetical protein
MTKQINFIDRKTSDTGLGSRRKKKSSSFANWTRSTSRKTRFKCKKLKFELDPDPIWKRNPIRVRESFSLIGPCITPGGPVQLAKLASWTRYQLRSKNRVLREVDQFTKERILALVALVNYIAHNMWTIIINQCIFSQSSPKCELCILNTIQIKECCLGWRQF